MSSLSFLPIAAECLKLAFHEHYRLTLRSLLLALFPLWPSQYKKLSNDDVFPEYVWTTKTRTATAASILGLSWAGCVAADRLPPHMTMRTTVYSAYPSIRFPEVLRDSLEDKSDGLNSHSNRLHQPIEMKTMPPSGNAPVSPGTIFQTKLTKCGRKPHSHPTQQPPSSVKQLLKNRTAFQTRNMFY